MRNSHRTSSRRIVCAAVALAMLVPVAWAQAQQPQLGPIEAALTASALQKHLTNYLADKLMLANKAGIELSRVAELQANNPKVKQFAQQLIADHKQFNDQLAQVSEPSDHQIVERPRRRLIPQVRTAAREGGSEEIFATLKRLNHEAARIQLEQSREMLQKYQGQDFDMAFLGLQIAQHSRLLAELKALEGTGSKEFQEALAAAKTKVEQHLKEAQMLAQQLEDNRTAS
jgi:predicted outer membrane protein